MKYLSLLFSLFLIAGCVAKPVVEKKKTHVIQQNTTAAKEALNSLSEIDFTVRFQKGSATPSTKETNDLIAWVRNNNRNILAVRGTGGAEKHRGLGEARALNIVNIIRSASVPVRLVILDYLPRIAGGRGLVYSIPADIESLVVYNAPMLIIE